MVDYSSIPNFYVKIVFAAHFTLISLASIGFWTSSSYLFYNTLLMVTLLWAVHKNDSTEPVQLAIFINGCSIILDIIVLALHFPDSHAGSERFSAAMVILHLVARPFTELCLVKLLQERTGSPAGGLGNMFASPRTRSYEDMDKNVLPTHSQPSGNHGSTIFLLLSKYEGDFW